jgi:pilus assembly protein CpaF
MSENELNDFTKAFAQLTKLMIERCDALEQKINQVAPATSRAHSMSQAGKELFEIQELRPQDLGALYPLLEDESVGDILINSPKDVFIEKNGKLERADVQFESNQELLDIANHIAKASGREFDRNRPYLDTRLIDGSRLNIVAPPLSLDGISMSIRKFPHELIKLSDLVNFGSMNENMASFLRICARSKINILVVGGTGSGKTTLLNSIAQHIAPDERIVTIEDAAELRLPLEHKVRLETKPKKADEPDYYEVTIRDLMINALRMRPDRIIVGETRGGEAFDMIQAMNTGHEGSMTTVHANSPRDALMRLENMINIAVPSMSSIAVKQRISSALDLIVMTSRLDDGSRKVTHITEISGMEGDVISTQDLFNFIENPIDEAGVVSGTFKQASIMPKIAKNCFKYGFKNEMNQIFGVGRVGGITAPTQPATQPAGHGGFGAAAKSMNPLSGGGLGIFGKSPKN